MKRYEVGERDIIGQGQIYIDHVEAMTAEALYSKSDIAAELAHRDIRISALETELAIAQGVTATALDAVLGKIAADHLWATKLRHIRETQA